jgi:hypothetical protein
VIRVYDEVGNVIETHGTRAILESGDCRVKRKAATPF